MQILKPIASIEIDKRRQKNDNTYPVKLRITFLRKQKYYTLAVNLTKEDYELISNNQVGSLKGDIQRKDNLKKVKLKLDGHLLKAHQVIDCMNSFSFEQFEKSMFEQKPKANDFFSIFQNHINQYKNENRLGTAISYQNALNALIKFRPSLPFTEITPEFLQSFENWFIAKGGSISTVGIYLRSLRTIINLCLEQGIMDQSSYPFGKRKYIIPAARNIKKALTIEEVGKIYHFKAIPDTWWQRAKDYWLFSYFANGMNMKDIAELTYDNLQGTNIVFIRAKTRRSTKAYMQPITIPINDDLKEIMERWKIAGAKFVFPILHDSMTIEQKQQAIHQTIKMTNKYMRLIAKSVGIEKEITTYYARHSFATILKRSGASTEFISDSLGHQSITTTRSYLDSFEDETKKEWMKVLSNF